MRCHAFKNSSQGLLLKLQSASFVAIHFWAENFSSEVGPELMIIINYGRVFRPGVTY